MTHGTSDRRRGRGDRLFLVRTLFGPLSLVIMFLVTPTHSGAAPRRHRLRLCRTWTSVTVIAVVALLHAAQHMRAPTRHLSGRVHASVQLPALLRSSCLSGVLSCTPEHKVFAPLPNVVYGTSSTLACLQQSRHHLWQHVNVLLVPRATQRALQCSGHAYAMSALNKSDTEPAMSSLARFDLLARLQAVSTSAVNAVGFSSALLSFLVPCITLFSSTIIPLSASPALNVASVLTSAANVPGPLAWNVVARVRVATSGSEKFVRATHPLTF